ncbi:MAG: DNA repair protein RadC [Pseudomonadota bacterium]
MARRGRDQESSAKEADEAAQSDLSSDLFGEAAAPPPVAPPDKPPEDHRHGHRDRLRTRFRQGGPGAVADYELLELILFRAIPRRDVKPLAKKLLARFKSLSAVLSAEPESLREIGGLGEAAITEFKIVAAAAQHMTRATLTDRPLLTNWSSLIEYCRAHMAHGSVEEFRVLFLDKKNVLIADEAQTRGTVDQVAVYPREVLRRALALNASAIIMVHNHPSGDPTPSKADIVMTKAVQATLTSVGIALHDHVVIGSAGAASFKSLKLL